jgi:hypothetical protein
VLNDELRRLEHWSDTHSGDASVGLENASALGRGRRGECGDGENGRQRTPVHEQRRAGYALASSAEPGTLQDNETHCPQNKDVSRPREAYTAPPQVVQMSHLPPATETALSKTRTNPPHGHNAVGGKRLDQNIMSNEGKNLVSETSKPR